MWEDNPIQTQSQCAPIPGRDLEAAGITSFSDLSTNDQHIFDHYREAITKQIREIAELHFPEDFEFAPTSIARQIESPDNCYFRIDLPHAVITIKIVPNAHINDLSKHVTLHLEPFVGREPSTITELVFSLHPELNARAPSESDSPAVLPE